MRSLRSRIPRFVYGGLALGLGALAFALGIATAVSTLPGTGQEAGYLMAVVFALLGVLALGYTVDQYLLLLRLPGRESSLGGTNRGSVMRVACRILNLPEDTIIQNLLHAEEERIWFGGRRGTWFGFVLVGTTAIALGAAVALESADVSPGVGIVWVLGGLLVASGLRARRLSAIRCVLDLTTGRLRTFEPDELELRLSEAEIVVTEGELIQEEGARTLYGVGIVWPSRGFHLPLAGGWTRRELAEASASRLAEVARWRRATD